MESHKHLLYSNSAVFTVEFFNHALSGKGFPLLKIARSSSSTAHVDTLGWIRQSIIWNKEFVILYNPKVTRVIIFSVKQQESITDTMRHACHLEVKWANIEFECFTAFEESNAAQCRTLQHMVTWSQTDIWLRHFWRVFPRQLVCR